MGMTDKNARLCQLSIEKYEAGMSSGDIARELHVKKDTVLNWLKKNGVEMRYPKKIDDDVLQEYAHRYYDLNETAVVLSEELGLTVNGFRARLRRFNKRKRIAKTYNEDDWKDVVMPEPIPNYVFYVPTRKPIPKITIKGKVYQDITAQVTGY